MTLDAIVHLDLPGELFNLAIFHLFFQKIKPSSNDQQRSSPLLLLLRLLDSPWAGWIRASQSKQQFVSKKCLLILWDQSLRPDISATRWSVWCLRPEYPDNERACPIYFPQTPRVSMCSSETFPPAGEPDISTNTSCPSLIKCEHHHITSWQICLLQGLSNCWRFNNLSTGWWAKATSCSLCFLWKVSMKTAGRSNSKWKSSCSFLLKSCAHLNSICVITHC